MNRKLSKKITVQCGTCLLKFEGYKKDNPKYCSRICSGKHQKELYAAKKALKQAQLSTVHVIPAVPVTKITEVPQYRYIAHLIIIVMILILLHIKMS